MTKPSKEEILEVLEILLQDIPADYSGIELMRAINTYIEQNKGDK